MQNTDKIEGVFTFKCGFCVNDMKHVFKGFDHEKTVFPANVWCMLHRDLGTILFDTGYSDLIYKNGILSRLYNQLNPAEVTEEDYIINKLQANHMTASPVNHIILSHGHPDHIGGLRFFEHAKIWMSEGVRDAIQKRSLRQLIFKNMAAQVPGTMELISGLTSHPLLSKYFDKVYDIFGDGSVLGILLEGHAKEQIGVYLPSHKLFLGADSAWGTDFLKHAEKMRLVPRLIQYNYKAYLDTTKRISRFMAENPDIEVVFSHSDKREEKYEQ